MKSAPFNSFKVGFFHVDIGISVWRALKKLELLLRIFPALQTFRVLHISMNAR